jgi:hypothetical protein
VIIGVADEATVAVVGIAAVEIVTVELEIEATGAVVVERPSSQPGEGMATVETSEVLSAAEVVIDVVVIDVVVIDVVVIDVVEIGVAETFEVVVIFSVEESSEMVVDAAAVT